MTEPVPRYPNETFLLTRKCIGDFFLLTPSEDINRRFLYSLALAQHHFPVKLHGYTFMSNHIHLVVTDPTGDLGSPFIGLLNSLVAKNVNFKHKLKGPVWDSTRRPNWCALTDKQAQWKKLVYTLVNPVAAGLVETHNQWPGLISSLRTLEKGKLKVNRPKGFFADKEERAPLKTLVLRFSPLPGAEAVEYKDYLTMLRHQVKSEEKRIQEERKKQNKPFLGAQAVRDMPVERRPVKKAPPLPAAPQKGKRVKKQESDRIKPRAAGEKDALAAWLIQYGIFQALYQEARKAFLAGDRAVEFPYGTYQMRSRWGLNVATGFPPESPLADRAAA